MEIRFLSVANREVDNAVQWYEAREEGLSREFLDELDRVVRLVRRYPFAGMQIEPALRRFLFTRFPYSLIYGIDEETIVVIAVASQHREPTYWSDRI
ncbi:MAG TPA: type II toxin-antitoxin system RelE/ParE family toxin [Pyrinomonadaceae bacterium]|nr:type II toxin-antitoxin system RelE/ParE family toxin [Pyrinomonadaceae bacterium]